MNSLLIHGGSVLKISIWYRDTELALTPCFGQCSPWCLLSGRRALVTCLQEITRVPASGLYSNTFHKHKIADIALKINPRRQSYKWMRLYSWGKKMFLMIYKLISGGEQWDQKGNNKDFWLERKYLTYWTNKSVSLEPESKIASSFQATTAHYQPQQDLWLAKE